MSRCNLAQQITGKKDGNRPVLPGMSGGKGQHHCKQYHKHEDRFFHHQGPFKSGLFQ